MNDQNSSIYNMDSCDSALIEVADSIHKMLSEIPSNATLSFMKDSSDSLPSSSGNNIVGHDHPEEDENIDPII